MTPNDKQVLIPEIYEFFIQFKILRWEDYLRLSEGVQCNQKTPYKCKINTGELISERDLKMEEGAVNQGIQITSSSWRRQANDFPLENNLFDTQSLSLIRLIFNL